MFEVLRTCSAEQVITLFNGPSTIKIICTKITMSKMVEFETKIIYLLVTMPNFCTREIPNPLSDSFKFIKISRNVIKMLLLKCLRLPPILLKKALAYFSPALGTSVESC